MNIEGDGDFYETTLWPDSFLHRGGNGGQGADSHYVVPAGLYYRAVDGGVSFVLQVLGDSSNNCTPI